MNCRICGAALPEGAMFCGECGSSTTATPLTRSRPDPRPQDTSRIEPLPPHLSGGDPHAESPHVEAPHVEAPPAEPAAEAVWTQELAPPRRTAPSFTLAFSTGAVAIVSGTGLIGRRPLPQPGEAFDQLVPVEDAERSVSKTHLEFGTHDGELWVSDRYSGNGTLIRRPDGTVLRCEAGRRYLVPRGSRVDIAELFFTVR
ncbi:hypothetical protein WDJ51_07335 [Rathayibacter sp. YIM 133350]|uniref:hypothetical protein n=1 Tax=Rathayibacter sp. YIM 133350 TaxID=3131992 RepID=UPI00307E1755